MRPRMSTEVMFRLRRAGTPHSDTRVSEHVEGGRGNAQEEDKMLLQILNHSITNSLIPP